MTEKKEHWIDDDQARKGLFGFVKGDPPDGLGLTEEELYEALAVPSIHDFQGTKADAFKLLKAYAKDIGLRRLVKSLAASSTGHDEAHAVAWCDVFAPDGTRIALTAREGARGETVAATALALWQGLAMLEHLGFTLPAENGKAAGVALVPEPIEDWQSTPPPPPPSTAPSAPPAQASSGNGGGTVKAGVAALNAIAVDHENKVLFYVDGFKWPFKDSRGPEAVLRYIDADLGFNEKNLVAGSKFAAGPYNEDDDEAARKVKAMMAGLVVEWEKPDKYYNVTRVRRLNK